MTMPGENPVIDTVAEAIAKGYQPVPIREMVKAPYGTGWSKITWTPETADEARAYFEECATKGAPGIGLALGDTSGGLVDVDIDHIHAWRLREHFLPDTAMVTGHGLNPKSHRWYIAKPGTLPPTRRYKLSDGASVSIEIRGNGAQTLIPPTMWWSKDKSKSEPYVWEGEPWGGDEGPLVVDGKVLATQVALAAMCAILLENWPREGSRHAAYVALAGGLLRYGDNVHPWWEHNIGVVIKAIADVTHDDESPQTRVSESVSTTIKALREGNKVQGWPTLGQIIGEEQSRAAERMAAEVESLAGFTRTANPAADIPRLSGSPLAAPQSPYDNTPVVEVPEVVEDGEFPADDLGESGPMLTLDLSGESIDPDDDTPRKRNPMEEREDSWEPVDLGPYLAGEIELPKPTVLMRNDGYGLFYQGLVNSIYGKSESCKSWISLYAGVQAVAQGERVGYLDFEDQPMGTVDRLLRLGMSPDDIRSNFRYIHPEGPLADMQRYAYGDKPTKVGLQSAKVFYGMLEDFDPTLLIVDGMTVIYGLHGHNTNDATSTDVITTWLKKLTRGGRTTVVVIDHTGKTGGEGASPIGAHHKIAMVQGTSLRADALKRPMPGEVGTVQLSVFKDRPGAVRQHSSKDDEQVAAIVTMDSTKEGVTTVTIAPKDPMEIVVGIREGEEEGLARALEAADKEAQALALMTDGSQWTTKEMAAALEVSEAVVRDLWHKLKSVRKVEALGGNRNRTYRILPRGKRVADPIPEGSVVSAAPVESTGEYDVIDPVTGEVLS